MLVDHIQELESAAVSRGIELKMHGLHLVGMISPVPPHRAVCGPCPLALPGSGPLEPFLPPEPLNPLVVHAPAVPPQQAIGRPPAPADVFSRDLPQSMAELYLLNIDNLATMALGAAVLPRYPADKAFRIPVTILKNRDSPAAAFRAQKFPSARSHYFAEECG